MKICFITSFFYPVRGGTETHIMELSKQLIKKGHSVTVFTTDLSRTGKIEKKQETINKIKIKRFNALFKIGDFASFWPYLFPEVKKSNFDIYHIHTYRNLQNFAVLFTKKPCILTPHWPNYPKGIRTRLADFLIPIFDLLFGRYLLKKFRRIITITDLETQWLNKKFRIPLKKITLIPNGIPRSYLKKHNRKKIRQRYKIKKNEILVLLMSRLHKSKGFDQAIKIAKYFPKVRFLICGKDEGFKPYLESLVKKLNLKNVIFAGEVKESEKLDYFAAADIFLHPSHYEGFGIVVLEAFSQKCAVLTSSQGGLPWVVDNAGLTFKDNNLKDLKNKLEALIKNKEKRIKLANLGYKRAKKFTWEKIANNLEKLYKEVTKNKV